MTMKIIVSKIFLCFLFFLATASYAAHPLITDDTGTQGSGRLLTEINCEYADDNGDKTTEIATTFSLGAGEQIDLVVSVPFLFLNPEENSSEHGVEDMGIEIKWRFFEKKGLSFAIKPGITLDTGDEVKGLGEGKPSYGIVFLTTKEVYPLALHLNLGYIKNKKELRNVWHYSLAGEYVLTDNLNVVGNIGGETNTDRDSSIHPLFLLGGIIFSITDNFDIDFGIKAGLNKAEADYTVMVGIALLI